MEPSRTTFAQFKDRNKDGINRFLKHVLKYDFATQIIKACCVLHNFVANRDGVRTCDEMHINECFQDLNDIVVTNRFNIRDEFCNYFNSDVGALPWQLTKI